jgi:predicted helicase
MTTKAKIFCYDIGDYLSREEKLATRRRKAY